MRGELDAELVLSQSLPGGRATLEGVLPGLAEEALARSLGKGVVGRMGPWNLEGDRLTLTLTAENGRAHQALLALTRRLKVELGRTAKVGVRTVRALRYRLTFDVPKAPTAPVSLPIPHQLRFGDGQATLELEGLDEEALRDNWSDRAVTLVEDKVLRQHYQGKEQYWKLLSQSPARNLTVTEDPTEAMLRRNWLRNGPTKGKWFLGPLPAHLLRTMERIAIDEVLRPLGFEEVVQPHHDSFDILLKTGHLEGVPGEFYYVAEPKSRDPAVWERFTDLVKITRKVPEAELANLVSGPVAVSCYAQCPTTYWWLSGRTIAQEMLPLKVFDRAAISNRYESGGRHGLERVDEFHRIEPVYLGTPEQLLELREQLLARYAHVFNDILELEWRTAWVTPFYMQQSGAIGVEDETQRIKGTIDFEAYLPYRGTREASEWLEFQNLSIVGDKYPKAFTIKTQKGELWSGCTGIGLERWLIAFLAQRGLDPTAWPAGFRKYAGELPREIRFL
ncbi:MAG: serine--tRNA ligase [Thermoplasmata archaeon]|nr:serine--tRNA ligase [Thermoplasmata archaeon]